MSLTVGDIHRVCLYCSLDQQVSMNIIHFRVTAVQQAGYIDESLPISYDMALRDLYIKLPGPSVMYHGLTVQRIHPAKGFQWPSVAPAVPCAGAVGTPMPKQIAGVLTFYDNTVTRAGRGRMYAPFPSKGEDSTAGSPVTTYIDALRAFGNLVKGAITLNDGQANAVGTVKSVLWHKASKAGTDITVIKPNAIWGTQRRRGDYGKANAVPAELPQT